MSWDGNGNFTRSNGTQTGATTWANARDAGNNITASQHDTHDQDLATGIQACLTKNNESKPTADFSPNANATYDLGVTGTRWRNLYLSGALTGEVNFTQNGDDATTEFLSDIIKSLAVTPQMFGAAADGVTDDSVAIQAALDTGRPVLLTDSTYAYATGLTIPRTGAATILGQGPNKSILKYTGNAKALAFKTDVDDVVRSPVLRDFRIDCSASTATHGLHLANGAAGNGFSWGEFRNLYILGADEAGSIGLLSEGVVYSIYQNVAIRDFDTNSDQAITGIPCSNNTLLGCVAMDGTTYNFRTRATTHGLKYEDCRSEGDPTYGFHTSGFTTGTQPDSHIFKGCASEDDPSGANFYFENCRNITMIGGGPGTNTVGDGISLVNVRSSSFLRVRYGASYAGGKYALTADTDSQLNEFTGYIRDTNNLGKVNIVNGRNRSQFDFSSNATSPYVFGGNGPATKTRSTTGGTIDPRDNGTYIADASGGNITITLSTVSAQNEGVVIEIKKKPGDTNTVTIDPSSAQTVDASATFVMRYDEEALVLKADATLGGWRIIDHYNPNAYVTLASGPSLTVPANARVVEITGTTNVTDMAVTGFKGKVVTLIFQGVLTFTDGNKLKLAGDFVTSADDSITLACNGSNWYEIARSAN